MVRKKEEEKREYCISDLCERCNVERFRRNFYEYVKLLMLLLLIFHGYSSLSNYEHVHRAEMGTT